MANDSALKRVFRPFDRPKDASGDELGNPWIAGAAVLLLFVIPLLPFFLVVWSISRTLRGVRERVSWE
jgi:hypothetical protein